MCKLERLAIHLVARPQPDSDRQQLEVMCTKRLVAAGSFRSRDCVRTIPYADVPEEQ